MTAIRVIGIDLGKNTFHLIGHDYSGKGSLGRSLIVKNCSSYYLFMNPLSSLWKHVVGLIG